jgi:hypothetical protein
VTYIREGEANTTKLTKNKIKSAVYICFSFYLFHSAPLQELGNRYGDGGQGGQLPNSTHNILNKISAMDPDSRAVGSVCFWNSWIRILLSTSKNCKKNLDSYFL